MGVSKSVFMESTTLTAITIRKAIPLNTQKRSEATRVSVSCRANKYIRRVCSKSRLGSSMGRANVREADASWSILFASGSYAGRDVSTESGIRSESTRNPVKQLTKYSNSYQGEEEGEF